MLNVIRFVVVLFAFQCFTSLLPAGQPVKPNIVFFLADDLGWTGLRSYGSDFYETPNIDQLALEGMRFTNAYSSCTVCSPTRAALMTGQNPARLRLTSFIPGQERPFAKMRVPDWTKGLKESALTLPEVLKKEGYRTIHVGKWHLNFPAEEVSPEKHGFDFSTDKPPGTKGYFLKGKRVRESGTSQDYLTDYLAEIASREIVRDDESPFFLYFAFHVPHTPIQGRPDLVEDFRKKIDQSAIHRNPEYAAMVKSMDMAVGTVMKALASSGKEGNTIVVFTSDNGGLTQRYGKHDGFTDNLPLRRGKGSAFEGGVRVPAVIKWPGIIEPGRICETPIITHDYFPTFLDVVNSQAECEFDGVSLLGILEGDTVEMKRDLFWHFPHYHAGGDGPYTAVRSGRWKLIERHEDGRSLLFDLDEDPGESNEIGEAHPDQVTILSQKIRDWRVAVGAQMPAPNPQFDPARAFEVEKRRKGR